MIWKMKGKKHRLVFGFTSDRHFMLYHTDKKMKSIYRRNPILSLYLLPFSGIERGAGALYKI